MKKKKRLHQSNLGRFDGGKTCFGLDRELALFLTSGIKSLVVINFTKSMT